MKELQAILSGEGIRVEQSCPLSAHSTFQIGGNADIALFPSDRTQLLAALRRLRAREIPFLVLGNAGNVVFSDEGFRGAVLFTGGCRRLTPTADGFEADAGLALSTLAIAARDAALTGAEFAHGIPGTVGGGVFMNAGAFGGCMADICVTSSYYDPVTDTCGTFTGTEHAFGNRTSIYEKNPHLVILGATVRLQPGEREAISSRMQELMTRRRTTQPLEYPSAGSVFKRPEGHFAGKLIEDCGLKGYRVGGAEVSQKHAGFIINRGGATARDVRTLVAHIQKTVLDATGVTLECEIRFL